MGPCYGKKGVPVTWYGSVFLHGFQTSCLKFHRSEGCPCEREHVLGNKLIHPGTLAPLDVPPAKPLISNWSNGGGVGLGLAFAFPAST